jgi:hypothetical protein
MEWGGGGASHREGVASSATVVRCRACPGGVPGGCPGTGSPRDIARVPLCRWALSRRLIISTFRVVCGCVRRAAARGNGGDIVLLAGA